MSFPKDPTPEQLKEFNHQSNLEAMQRYKDADWLEDFRFEDESNCQFVLTPKGGHQFATLRAMLLELGAGQVTDPLVLWFLVRIALQSRSGQRN